VGEVAMREFGPYLELLAGFYKRQCQEKVLPPRRRGG
jgi:hypothetical protein